MRIIVAVALGIPLTQPTLLLLGGGVRGEFRPLPPIRKNQNIQTCKCYRFDHRPFWFNGGLTVAMKTSSFLSLLLCFFSTANRLRFPFYFSLMDPGNTLRGLDKFGDNFHHNEPHQNHFVFLAGRGGTKPAPLSKNHVNTCHRTAMVHLQSY